MFLKTISLKFFILSIILTFVSICLAHDKEVSSSSVPYPVSKAHNYLEVAYDITPYESMNDEALIEILLSHPCPQGKFEVEPLSHCVADKWIIRGDILQVFFLRKSKTTQFGKEVILHRGLDDALTYSSMYARNIKNGMWRDHAPKEALFFFWKRAAWIDADMADSLAEALTNGFEDLVPKREDWADYWTRRARILREQPQWYKPEKFSE